MTQPIAVRSFAHAGIDLPGVMAGARKQGINPLYAFLGQLEAKVKGKDPVDAAFTLGKLLHNQQAGVAALSLVQHKDEFLSLVDRLHQSNKSTLDTDFITASRSVKTQLDISLNLLKQLDQRLGEGLVPAMQAANLGLLALVQGIKYLDEHAPGLVNGILLVTSGLIALGAAVGVFTLLAPVVTAAFGVLTTVVAALLSPWGLLVMAIAGTAYVIYDNWGTIKSFVESAAETVLGAWHRLMGGVQAAIADVWNSLAGSAAGRALGLGRMDDGRGAPGWGDRPDNPGSGTGDWAGVRPLAAPAAAGSTVTIKLEGSGQFQGIEDSFKLLPGSNQTITPLRRAPERGETLNRP